LRRGDADHRNEPTCKRLAKLHVDVLAGTVDFETMTRNSYYVAMSELLAMREAASREPSQDLSVELRRRYMLERPSLTSQPDEETR
jgi:hypothetical protein